MTDVVAHLRACEARFNERALRPVVAWDCLGAASWSRACRMLAAEIESAGLTGEQAIGYLKAKAHEVRTRTADMDRGIGFLVGLDAWTRFDEIIDPIARDRRGWIEVRGHSEHFGREGVEGMPTYRRMLGVNHCVASLSREWKEESRRRGFHQTPLPADAPRACRIEPEDSWEARRLEWLGRYHPGILVIHAEGGWERDARHDLDADYRPGADLHADIPRACQYTPIYGTVAQHMAEPMPTLLPCAIGTVHRVPVAAPLAMAA